jgi:hypothetical protein
VSTVVMRRLKSDSSVEPVPSSAVGRLQARPEASEAASMGPTLLDWAASDLKEWKSALVMVRPETVTTCAIGYVSDVLQKGPDTGKGQGISEKLLADNFEAKEMNRWPDRRLSEKVWIGKSCSKRKRIF